MKWFNDLSDTDFYCLKHVLLKNNCRCEFSGRNNIGVDEEDLMNLIIKKGF